MNGLTFRFLVNSHVKHDIEKACKEAAIEAAEALAENARERTPVDTGALRESCTVTAEGDEASVSYSAPYAVYVHERTWVSHPTGQAKFLEDAVYDTGVHGNMLGRCASSLRKVFG